MALVADPEQPGELYAIMGCFPGYNFREGAIYRIRREAGRWAAVRIIGLPFAHRIDFVSRGGRRFLVAASLATDKQDPSDWSQPGCLFVCPTSPQSETWTLTPVLEGIHRNHGLLVTRFHGRQSILASGTEGLFAADLEHPGASWSFTRVLEKEISEIAVADLDSDGEEELVTIEPFHGDTLRVYKRTSGGWETAWEGEIAFGHGLLTGFIGGHPAVLVSNRAGSKELILFQFSPGCRSAAHTLAQPARTVIDSGVGAANMLILPHDGADLVFSTNQATGEIVIYSVAP
jgi:hypothetical protein